MKRILILCMLMLTALLTAQTQTLNGVKTFTSPPKFKNLQNNNANTKVLTVNATDVLQWKDASTLLDNNVVRLTGNQTVSGIKTFQNIIQLDEPQLQFSNYYSGNYNILQNLDNSWFFGKNDGGQVFSANPIGFSTFKSGTIQGNFTNLNLTATRNWDLPNASGTIALEKPYKVYTALLSQTGTGNPTVIILENNTSLSLSFYRISLGTYSIVIDSMEPNFNKVIFEIEPMLGTNQNYSINKELIGSSTVSGFNIYTKNSGSLTDGILFKCPIEIRVYN